MRTPAKLLLGAATAALISTSAYAADPVMMTPTPAPMAAPAFDWSGPYVGAFATYTFPGLGGYPQFGVQAGYNFVFHNNLLAGLEVATAHFTLPAYPFVDASLNGRFGFIVQDRVLIYGEAGIGVYITSVPVVSLGAGVELAVTNSISVFGEAKRIFIFGGGLTPFSTSLTAGLNYHPGGSMMMASSGPFDGLYFGALGGYFLGPNLAEAGVQFGFNHMIGSRFVVGTEIETYYPFTGAAIVSASLNGRLGATFGNFLVYGQAGIGTWIGVPLWNAGGGVEFALGGRDLSLFAEAAAQFVFGGGGYFGTRIDGGLNFAVGGY